MNDDVLPLAYVHAALAQAGVPVDEARVRRVAAHFARTTQLAALLEAVPMHEDDEPPELYAPAPFPARDDPQEPV